MRTFVPEQGRATQPGAVALSKQRCPLKPRSLWMTVIFSKHEIRLCVSEETTSLSVGKQSSLQLNEASSLRQHPEAQGEPSTAHKSRWHLLGGTGGVPWVQIPAAHRAHKTPPPQVLLPTA